MNGSKPIPSRRLIRVKLTLGGNATDTGTAAPTLAITREIAAPSGTLPSVAQNGSVLAGGAVALPTDRIGREAGLAAVVESECRRCPGSAPSIPR